MAKVVLKNVSKIYEGGTLAAKEVNFEINNKEFIVLVGPSGCGKSTILRMIAGLEDITEGEIFIDDKLVNNIPPKNRDIAMVFQNYALYPHMTVYENISFGLIIRKIPKKEIKKRVEEVAEILGLKELLQRKPKALSGGQRQRVALGRAIVRKPKVFLFDEPLSNLDAKLRVQMRTEIAKLHQRLGVTMIYVTHDQTEAMTMGDRIVVMKDGLVQQIDSPLNLYHCPKNKFVAGFIGSPAMNFIEGEIILESHTHFLIIDQVIKIILLEKQIKKIENYVNKKIIIGIRPENISLATSNNKKDFQITTSLDVVELMGNETIINFRLNKTQIIGRVQSDERLYPNYNCKLYFNLEKLNFFDTDSGKVIS